MPSEQDSSPRSPADDEIAALRDALRVSPKNAPLRRHLAQTLVSHGYFADAERELRHLLNLQPNDDGLKLQLASTFHQQGKRGQALVLVEDLIANSNEPARAYLLQARLFYGAGDVPSAVEAYHQAVGRDPSVEDRELRVRLGIGTSAGESEVVEGRVAALADEAPPRIESDVQRPTIQFADVGGMEALKEEIRLKIIHPLTHADLYKAYGKTIGGGILMYGPPGCGKTLLARATAGEINADFIAVGISDVLEMWIGSSERNLHALFEQARARKPCVLFFDEVDALGASRIDMRQSAGRQLINQFLAELDGVQDSNDGVLILAATNAPWHLDSAFRRPGRFDRILFVPPPDPAARAAILRLHLEGKPSEALDFDAVAKRTLDCSGADLKGLVDLAVEAKLREAMKSGIPTPLRTADLIAAAGKVKPSTREWFSTARNYALYSNQGGTYDDILRYLKM
jgi:transitional endoplasmic reticulum ATPase